MLFKGVLNSSIISLLCEYTALNAMDRGAPILLAATSILLIVVASQSILIFSPPEPPSQSGIGLFEAVEIGRCFLDGLNATDGRLLSTAFEVRAPNLYWQEALLYPPVHSFGFTDLQEL